jgi:Family of unknown function (DUF5343)
MIGFLKKHFPATVTSETVKKFHLAPNNESYVINALQFIGLIDEQGKRTDKGHEVLTTHDDANFKAAFADLVRTAYKDLFDLRGDDAWTMSRNDLISYFRTTDKTSAAIGARQAAVFQVFRVLSGYEQGDVAAARPKDRSVRRKAVKTPKANQKVEAPHTDTPEKPRPKPDIALTVRIEINLPAEGSQQTYDNIFKSIKANLLP